ncbi:hypothetical protein NDA10_003070 [Ustilago hordei]|nr:hypothetical protein NDA10_003070 [Ustilago hordei]UTT96780.1 hypothetical protein NDA17_003789 [Ustilago hordei]
MAGDSGQREASRRAQAYTRKHPRDKKDQSHHKQDHRQLSHSDQPEQHHDRPKSHGHQDAAKPQGKSDESQEHKVETNQAPQPAAAVQAASPRSALAVLPPPVANNAIPQVASPVTGPTVSKAQASAGKKPSVSAMAGIALGIVVLLLMLGSVLAYKFGHRKKKGAQLRSSAGVISDPSESYSPAQGYGTGQIVEKVSGLSYGTGLQTENSVRATQERSAEAGMEPQHLSLSMSPPRERDLIAAQGDHGQRSSLKPEGLQQSEQSEPGCQPQLQHQSSGVGPLNGGHRSSFKDGERTCEGDDDQIERCLSYYMKRHTRASAKAAPVPDASVSLHEISEQNAFPQSVRNSLSRRSFKFPKTANLFEKIRRSQLRLNDEALSKARGEDLRISAALAHTSDSQSTSPSRYDQSCSTIPAHWRSSTKLRQDEELDNEITLGSSPHSAFEYADYYDSYLPGPHTSIRLQRPHEDIEEDGFALPWQNNSPCRSSALSPRRSTTTVSVRQRSTSFNQGSPCWPPSEISAGNDSNDRRGHLSHVSANSYRESAEAGEVIRF